MNLDDERNRLDSGDSERCLLMELCILLAATLAVVAVRNLLQGSNDAISRRRLGRH